MTPLDAYKEIYSKLKPTEIPRPQKAKEEIEDMYFNPSKFDFSDIGRQKSTDKTQRCIYWISQRSRK